jgi:hypothetical protein
MTDGTGWHPAGRFAESRAQGSLGHREVDLIFFTVLHEAP